MCDIYFGQCLYTALVEAVPDHMSKTRVHFTCSRLRKVFPSKISLFNSFATCLSFEHLISKSSLTDLFSSCISIMHYILFIMHFILLLGILVCHLWPVEHQTVLCYSVLWSIVACGFSIFWRCQGQIALYPVKLALLMTRRERSRKQLFT